MAVIHIKDAPKGWQHNKQFVYIGRDNGRKKLKGSKWFNPFKIGPKWDRMKVLSLYNTYIRSLPMLLADLGELEGKTLVCWCKPEDCHGDILEELLAERE